MIWKCAQSTLQSWRRVFYLGFMADGIKARLQRFNLFNTKQEPKYVSLRCVKVRRSALLRFRLMLSGKLTLAHCHRGGHRALKLALNLALMDFFSHSSPHTHTLFKLNFHEFVYITSEYKALLICLMRGIQDRHLSSIHRLLVNCYCHYYYWGIVTITGHDVTPGQYPGMLNISALNAEGQ